MQDPDWVTEGGAGGGERTREHEWDEMSEGGELEEFGGGVDRIDVGHRRLDGCAWITVSGCEDVQWPGMGTFELAGECDGRPMYEKSNGEKLYYNTANSVWFIGTNGCGSATVGVYAATAGAEPSSSSGWMCADGGSWTSYSLSVGCVACSSNCAAGSGCALQVDNSASCESCEVGEYSSTNDGSSSSLAVKLAKTHGLAKLTELDSYAHNIGANGQDNVLVSDTVAELKNDMDTQRLLIMEEHVSFVYDRNTREREILGKGAFGSVFLGVYMGAEVAVKEITSEQIDADSMGRFIAELKLTSSLRHPSIIQVLGATFGIRIGLVCELASNGSLSSFLKNTKKSSNDSEVSWLPRESVSRGGSEASKLNWALEIANGVLYLHSQPVPVLHRDLKAANILLDHGLHCKITDFGESTEKALTHNPKDSMTTVGTPYFMAPELFESIPNYNSKVDVYAFAVLLLEIHMDGVLSAAFANMNPMVAIKAITMDMWRPDLKVLLANCEIPEIAGLIESCWQQKPEDRPSMDAVVKTIGKLKRQYMFLAGEEDSKSMFRTMSVQKKIEIRRKSQIATDLDNSKPLPNSLALLMKGR
ncbi:hypothetical protein ScalyP_jg727 [Parmales sp. scaly parma]|nr:hypothetical protein ScalyP_jg727 [Parmales sp. scaly parma]